MTNTQGSPPRMRGKGVVDVLVSEPLGITPAYAGKSFSGTLISPASLDHPRVCGEKHVGEFNDKTAEGSPPRMRGKVFQLFPVHHDKGITPACAGKSTASSSPCPVRRDHPRACGEKTLPPAPVVV